MDTYQNIKHPDHHQISSSMELRKRMALLKTELEFSEARYNQACSDLRSIADRVRAGDPVFIDYPDGARIYLTSRPDPDPDEE